MPNSVGIIFVGRNNRTKRSDTLEKVEAALKADGVSVHSFTAPRIIASDRINKRLAQLWPAVAASFDRTHPFHLRMLRLLLKGLMVLCANERWDFARALFLPKSLTAVQELARFVSRSPFRKVHLITHSAGGITATKISKHPKIVSICCFGYPFKHPEHPSESYRVRHLAEVSKPFLIVQGTSDEYGPPSPSLRAILPPHAQIVALDCGHDYATISDAEFEKMWIALQDLIAEPKGAPNARQLQG
ncbi:hypothetical protein NSE01_33620 [Novosphingobium sediminis]|uniref:KANL3/Tex30 alpha/beta hydrolase-like domain-containing protein n=1 Tax=Novosphingobium sediminis TaxID=707214 RepID=A0A512AP95_9SPHN|nr:alpha/beta family hydrolase [Novosphingobium sediminis]GEO01530.1 hypothetical protein NSE01_33620 [Novosphingobium sediminis]